MTPVAKAGDRGIDFAGLRLDTDGEFGEFKKANGRFFIRYSAGVGNSHSGSDWKLCGAQEIGKLSAYGDFIANSEWYESRLTEGGAAGRADGRSDLAFWKSRGYARNAVIITSWDQHPDVSRYDDVAEYLDEYGQALEDYYALGLYAGSAAIRHMKALGLITVGWQMMSTSFSDNHLPWQPTAAQVQGVLKNPPTDIDLWQDGNKWYGPNADENVMLRNVPTHLRAMQGDVPPVKPRPPVPPKPVRPPKPPAGGVYVVRPSDSDGLIAVCKRHEVSDWRAVARLNDIPGPKYVIHAGDIIRWPGGPGRPRRPSRPHKAVYTVKEGDTLSAIANRWGVSLSSVEKANPRAGHPAGHFDVIHPGDKITHP